jgi:hypothetical protein
MEITIQTTIKTSVFEIKDFEEEIEKRIKDSKRLIIETL